MSFRQVGQALMKSVAYIVTLYNKAPYLAHLLGGLSRQVGDFDKSFIFVDDGSTDDTLERLKAETRRWSNVLILEQANLGPSAALNRGFAAARTDFVKPVDGDDMLTPHATAILVDAIDRTGCAVAYANHSLQRTYATRESPEALLHDDERPAVRCAVEDQMLRLSLRSAQTNPSVWLARRETVVAAGGCDPGIFIQDYSIELRMAALGPFVRVDAPLVFFPADDANRLSRQQAQTLHDVNRAVVRLLLGNPSIADNLRRFGLKRAAARAWSWARRHNAESVFSRQYWYYLLACVGRLRLTERVADDLCRPFRDTAAIRVPPSP